MYSHPVKNCPCKHFPTSLQTNNNNHKTLLCAQSALHIPCRKLQFLQCESLKWKWPHLLFMFAVLQDFERFLAPFGNYRRKLYTFLFNIEQLCVLGVPTFSNETIPQQQGVAKEPQTYMSISVTVGKYCISIKIFIRGCRGK